MHHVAAVVDDDVRLHGQRSALEIVVFFQRAAMGRQYGHAPAGQARADVVLRGQRIGAGGVHLAAALVDHLRQISGLRLQVDADHHFQPGKGLLFPKLSGNAAQNGHVLFNPVDFLNPLRGQPNIPDHGIHAITSFEWLGIFYHICLGCVHRKKEFLPERRFGQGKPLSLSERSGKLGAVQGGVGSIPAEKLLMPALLHDLAVLHHQNQVGAADSG